MQEANIANKSMHIARLLDASIGKVWEAWTDPKQIAMWWGPAGFASTIHKMNVEVGGEWLLTMYGPGGKKFPNKSIYREIVPFEKIVFEHFNPNYIATIIFEARDFKTFIDWTVCFETVELFDIVVKTFKADEGLKENVGKLENYLIPD